MLAECCGLGGLGCVWRTDFVVPAAGRAITTNRLELREAMAVRSKQRTLQTKPRGTRQCQTMIRTQTSFSPSITVRESEKQHEIQNLMHGNKQAKRWKKKKQQSKSESPGPPVQGERDDETIE
eukprot:COSAG06_NODE_8467_length_2163_cov_3.223353_2_plen_123_part_00